MQLRTRSHAHFSAIAPGRTAVIGRADGTITAPAIDLPADPAVRPATTTFAVVQTPAQERVVDERGTVLGVWDRSTGLGWVLGADCLVSDGVDWFLSCVRGRSPLDADARRALAEIAVIDYR